MTLNLGKIFYLSKENENKITLWLNHLLVIYSFLIPIHNGAKSSLFFTMLVLFMYRRNYWYYLKEAFSNKIVQAFLLFYFVYLVGMTYSEDFYYTKKFMDKVKYLLFPLVFLAFLDLRFSFRIIYAFICGVLFAEILSYLIYFNILPYELFIGQYEVYKTIISRPLIQEDHSTSLVLSIALILYFFINRFKDNLVLKLLSILFILLSFINMLIIPNRTSYVVLIILVLFSILYTYKKNISVFFITFISLLIVSIASYNYFSLVQNRVDLTINSINNIIKSENYSSSLGLRIGFAKYSLEVIKNEPLLGVGTGDYMQEVRKRLPPKYKYIGNISYPHNLYIQILLQIGIIGLCAFFYLIYQIINYQASRDKKAIMLIVAISSLLYASTTTLFASYELPLFVVFISAMIAEKKQNIEVKQLSNNQFLKYAIIVIVFLIIGITR